jgi:DNA methylase
VKHEILCGDALAVLRRLPAASVHSVVTSPPYWGLRDYGVKGQIGLEKTPEEYVARLVEIFHEVRRVLRDDGTLWLNLGDSYATGAGKVGNCPGGGKQGERWKERGPFGGYRGKHDGSPKHRQVPDGKNPAAGNSAVPAESNAHSRAEAEGPGGHSLACSFCATG